VSPIISFSEATFEKLQQLAKPFVDTPESVVAMLADEELKRRASASGKAETSTSDQAMRLEPDRHDSLTHARLISATVDGKELHRPKWNNLLDHLHILGRERLGSFDALKRVSGARLRPGRYEEEGFHYLPQADLSIQGLEANLAWDHSLGLARHLRVPLRVKFEWRDKEGAARPGQRAVMEWSPTSLAVA
jgi:hypothetical protein